MRQQSLHGPAPPLSKIIDNIQNCFVYSVSNSNTKQKFCHGYNVSSSILKLAKTLFIEVGKICTAFYPNSLLRFSSHINDTWSFDKHTKCVHVKFIEFVFNFSFHFDYRQRSKLN